MTSSVLCFLSIILFNSLTILSSRYCYYFNFTDEEIEAKEVKTTCCCRHGDVAPRFVVMLPTWVRGVVSFLLSAPSGSAAGAQHSWPEVLSVPSSTHQVSAQGMCIKAWPFQLNMGHWQSRASCGAGSGCVGLASFTLSSIQCCFCSAFITADPY